MQLTKICYCAHWYINPLCAEQFFANSQGHTYTSLIRSKCMYSGCGQGTGRIYMSLACKGLNTWWKIFIMIIIMLCYIYQLSKIDAKLFKTFQSFSNSKCKTVSIKIRKILHERRLRILKFSQDKPQNVLFFLTFWLLKIFS